MDTTLPKALRQKELKEVYSFACQCKLCSRAVPADPREALWCPKRCGGVCPYPTEGASDSVRDYSGRRDHSPLSNPTDCWVLTDDPLTRCVKCNAPIGDTDAVLDALRVGEEALDKATALQFRGTASAALQPTDRMAHADIFDTHADPAKARQLTSNILPILTSVGATPSSHPLLAMTRLHQELLIADLPTALSQETLDETVRTAAKYSAGLQSLLPKGHPVRAVALGELGKLLAVDELSPPSGSDAAGRFPPSGPARLKLAYESLVKAHEELLIGFGKAGGGGQLGREVREAIVRLEKELGVWTSGIRNALEDTRAARAGPSSK